MLVNNILSQFKLRSMVDVRELRIGNWVDYNFPNPQIKVKIEVEDIVAIKEGDTNYTPIPLTPEVLEKCGFELVNGIYWTWFRISLEQIENDKEYFSVSKSYGEVGLDITVQYLHQLQNFCYSPTGQELEIKL